MAVQLTKQEEERCERLQKIYDLKVSEVNHLIENGETPSCHEVRTQRQEQQEAEYKRRIEDIEEGEVVDMVIELADYRIFRCVYGLHLIPIERVVRIL